MILMVLKTVKPKVCLFHSSINCVCPYKKVEDAPITTPVEETTSTRGLVSEAVQNIPPQTDVNFLVTVNTKEGSVWSVSDDFLTIKLEEFNYNLLTENGGCEDQKQATFKGNFERNCVDSIYDSYIRRSIDKLLGKECQGFMMLAWGDKVKEKSSTLFQDPQNPSRMGLAELTISQIHQSAAQYAEPITLEGFLLQASGPDVIDLVSGIPIKLLDLIQSVSSCK